MMLRTGIPIGNRCRHHRVGDQVLLGDGRSVAADRIELRGFEGTVYNMEVDGLHCDTVGQNSVLAHDRNIEITGRRDAARNTGGARARHHTDAEGVRGIANDGAINPSRGQPPGVDVETEPFGPTRPGPGGPQAEMGSTTEGAYVEIDLPDNAVTTNVGPRNTARIATPDPLPIGELNPKFVRVRRWWNLWYFWR